MPEWTIPRTKPEGGGSNPLALVGCQIVEAVSGTSYVFVAADGTIESTTTGTSLPGVPFRFPMFRSRLGAPGPESWYITVQHLHAGPLANLAKGISSNKGFGDEDIDDDETWVAHAGATFENDEAGESAAASASSNKR